MKTTEFLVIVSSNKVIIIIIWENMGHGYFSNRDSNGMQCAFTPQNQDES